jgi:hypothetical protein
MEQFAIPDDFAVFPPRERQSPDRRFSAEAENQPLPTAYERQVR